MAFTEWDITEGIPADLGGRTTESGSIFRIDKDAFDVAIGELPFLVCPSEEHPYRRRTVQWRKEQIDTDRQVGEQSFDDWWRRSQQDFSGGAGVTFYEPILGEGSENRFIDSRGLDVFHEDGIRLLNQMTVLQGGAGDDVELTGLGVGYALYRNAGQFRIVGDDTITNVTVPGTNARGITRIPDSSWLVGHDTGITRVRDSGATSSVVSGASAPLRPYWCKDRIFAAQNNRILELTLSSGDISGNESSHVVHQNPSTAWRWVGIVETPGAVWAAGGANSRSHVMALVIDNSGDTPVVTEAGIRIQMPMGERITCIESYLDYLLIGTTEGFRIAITDGDQAQLGPLLWEDEEPFSITARWDFAWVGVSGGLTRKVNLGNQTGDGLRFAWSHAEELAEGGNVMGLGWAFRRMVMAVANVGVARQHATNLVPTGWMRTGYARFATLENKVFHAVRLLADSSHGSIAIGATTTRDPYTNLTTLATWSGAREVDIRLPGNNPPAERLSLEVTLNRDPNDPTRGPVFEGYQLRALPAPSRRQTLIEVPLQLYDYEATRWGQSLGGGERFAWKRLEALERLRDEQLSMVFRDFRTGESRIVIVDDVEFFNLFAPERQHSNFSGWANVVLRTVD